MTTTALPPGCVPLGLNKDQAAAYCGVSVDLFDKLVDARTLPEPVRLGARRVVWDKRRLAAAFDRLQGLSPSLRTENDEDDFLEALEDG